MLYHIHTVLCQVSVVHMHLAVASNEADFSLHFGSAAACLILANVSAWS